MPPRLAPRRRSPARIRTRPPRRTSLIQTQRRAAPADLPLVPRALHAARAQHPRLGRLVGGHVVPAVALRAVLEPGVREGLALAEVDARLHRHARVALVARACQRARVVVVRAAAGVREAPARHVREARVGGLLARARGRRRDAAEGIRGALLDRGRAGPGGDGVAAREGREGAGDGLWDLRGEQAGLAVGVGGEGEVRAVLHDAVGVVAVGDGGGERGYVPAVDEVAVEAVAGGVALGEDPGVGAGVGGPLGGEGVDVVDDLVEDGYQVDRVGGGAGAVVVGAG